MSADAANPVSVHPAELLHAASAEAIRYADDAARGRVEPVLGDAHEQRGAAERTLRTTKGHLTRSRKRACRGLCPFCKRHFVNVQRHVETKHPDAAKEAGR